MTTASVLACLYMGFIALVGSFFKGGNQDWEEAAQTPEITRL